VSGAAADAFTAGLEPPLGLEVVSAGEGRWWLRAPDHRVLCDALAAAFRPPGRLRIEVDPLRL
jgi:primosomal protein N' (replication factor Y)